MANLFAFILRGLALLLLFFCFVCLGSPLLRAQDFKFTDFSSTSTLALNGNAAAAANGSGADVLRLTSTTSLFQVGSAWFCGSDCSFGTGKVLVSQGFSTTFKFQLSGSNSVADGIAFVVQNGCFSNETCGISAIDPVQGGGIGYDGLTNSVAFEFDTFCNGATDKSDNCGVFNGFSTANEVGIQSCGTSANTANHANLSCNFGQVDLSTLFFSDGGEASTTAGSKTVMLTGTHYTAAQMQNMVGLSFVISTLAPNNRGNKGTGTNFGLIAAANVATQTLTLANPASTSYAATVNYAIEPVLADGNVHTATITYTPPTSCGEGCINPNLTVTVDNNVVLVSSSGIDIVGNVLPDGADGALVGFTAGTGTFFDNQDVLSWTFDTAQTNTVSCLTLICPAFTEFYSYDGGADTWMVNFGPGVPNGALLTAWRTELTEAEWAQRTPPGTPYSGTTLAPVSCTGFANCNIVTGDGVIWSALLTVNGIEFNPPIPVLYTLTAIWNSTDNNYANESPGFLKAHPIGADDWQDILLLTFNSNIDPLPGNKGTSKTPCSDYANVSGVAGTPPAVTITSPANDATYLPGQVVDAIFSCSGNSVTDCLGTQDPATVDTPVSLHRPVDTSAPGPHTFSVVAVSSGPSGTASSTYNISSGRYGVQLLYPANAEVKSGADFPIKIYLTNSSGTDVSSPSIMPIALQVILVSTFVGGDVMETGGSNPDFNFRFDRTLGPKGGYIFNLKTTGLHGQYVLQFKVTPDSPSTTTYTVPFGVN